MLVNKATRWCLGFVDVPWPWKARVHAIGAAIHLRMVMLSCIGEVLCTAADGAMCGDSLRASQCLSFCNSLTRLLGFYALPTTPYHSKEVPHLDRFGSRLGRTVP